MRYARLKTARMESGLTRQQAAKQLNKSLSTIKSWEILGGHDPRLDDACRACQLYSITLDWYISGTPPKRPINKTYRRIIEHLETMPEGKTIAVEVMLTLIADR